jgi:hypothetical protein
VAAIGIVVALLAVGGLLAQPYLRNLQLQDFLEELAARPESVEAHPAQLSVAVMNRAAQLGLPVREDQIQVNRSGDSLRIEARYVVRVDFAFYTVDLHLRARGGT